jgi:hypothetical protein
MASAGHVSHEMLQHYSHVRPEAKRRAVEALSGETDQAGGYDTKYVTNGQEKAEEAGRAGRRIAGQKIGRERGFEPPTPWSRNNNGSAISLIRLAWLCVRDHGFTRFSGLN